MAGFELQEWIGRSPGTIFDFIADTGNASAVVPNVVSMEKLTDGPVGVGTRYRETRRMSGQEHETELEIVRYDPPHHYSMRNETRGIETIYHYQLAPEQDGTQVTLVCDVQASGLKKAVVPVVVAMLKREDGDHLERLKEVVEKTRGR